MLLSAVAGRPESDAEADGVLRRALQLARDAGYVQAQAQVTYTTCLLHEIGSLMTFSDMPETFMLYAMAGLFGDRVSAKMSVFV